MIPVRVLLKNFLCYTETADGQPIEFDFEGSSLWSISGDNGAGKSAIFDAVTYALFGQHRGGAQEDSRLIHKGADRCEATFEFRLDGRLYQVRRTVGRPRGKARQEPKTWQAAQFDPASNAWRPIKETERAVQFDRWVQDKLGLRYETFIASVMLVQGQSDQLITAQSKKRFEILSGLLDLEPYKKLEAVANDRKREAQRQAEDLKKRLGSLPAVAQEEIEKAKAELQENEHALGEARSAEAQAEVLISEAQRYAKLQNDLSAVERALAEKKSLLRNDERIRSEYQEWQQLSSALPKLRDAVEDLQGASKQAAQAQQKQSQIATIDMEALKRAKDMAEQEENRAEERYKTLRIRSDELGEALPLLRDVLSCHRTLEARKQDLDKQGGPQQWEDEVTRLTQLRHERQQEQGKAEESQKRAVEAKAKAQAAVEQAHKQLTARLEAQNEAVCSRCGQPVDSKHIQRELDEAEQAVTTAQREEKTATQDFDDTERKVKDLASSREEINKELQQARESFAGAQLVEKAWKEAKAKFQDAVRAAEQAPLEFLSVVASGSLTDADKLLHKLNAERTEVRTKLTQAEEGKHLASRNKGTANDSYEKALRDLQRLQGDAKRLDDGAQALRKQAEVRLADVVDPQWRERAQAEDLSFIEALAKRRISLQGIEQQYADLGKAADERNRLEARLEEIRRNIDSVQPEYRIQESEARKKAEQVRNHTKELQKRRDDSFQVLRDLKGKQQDRRKLEEDEIAARKQQKLYTRLVELLGRNGLQSYLLDEAIQSIAHLANETLTRISGGQLRLHIERAEEEIAIRATDLAFSEEPLDVRFISGSQKFRVAVALAAGIGQYAGRGVGSVRSLIIDEGFGSLDTQGRQEMIDELRNLSQFLDRVIIVSHQEDFQDRTLFPTGYILRKVDQRTQIERFV
jgi:exonuclease SbcC